MGDASSSLGIKLLDVSSINNDGFDDQISTVTTTQVVCEDCNEENQSHHVSSSQDENENERADAHSQSELGDSKEKHGKHSDFLSYMESIEDIKPEDNSDLSEDEIERLLLGDEEDIMKESNRLKYAYFYSSHTHKPVAAAEPTFSISNEDKQKINSQPQVFLWTGINNAMCRLDISKVTTVLQTSNVTDLSLLSEEQRRERDERIDKDLIANEQELRTKEEYQKQWDETIRKEGDGFASDHLPSFYVNQNSRFLLQRERSVIGSLSARMHSDSCFAPIVEKYAKVKKELTVSPAELLNQVRHVVNPQRIVQSGGVSKSKLSVVNPGLRAVKHNKDQLEYEKKVVVTDSWKGVAGSTGSKGSTGSTGSTGLSGSTGSTGFKASLRSTHLSSPKASVGSTGSNNFKGSTHLSSPKASSGLNAKARSSMTRPVCDGCFVTKKPLLTRTDFHDGILLRKLVGDEEVMEVNTKSTRFLSTKRVTNRLAPARERHA